VKVLVVTNMYPTEERRHFGIFVDEQVSSLRRCGVEIDVLFVDGKASKLNYLAGFPRLWKRLRSQRYDLIHAHYIFAGLVARGQLGRPVVLTHHGPEVFMTWQAWVCRAFTRFFDSVIVVSEEMRTKLGTPGAHVIPCGVDMSLFQPADMAAAREKLGLPPDRKLVLWAGEHQRPEKRFELVSQAMELLKARLPGVDLVLLSNKPHSTVPDHLNACDALVLTSDAEGSPMVVKEAMACNVPVVSTAVGDVPQLLAGLDGHWLCSQDPADIADKLEAALDYGKRTSGRERVFRLDLDNISREIISVYEATLARTPRRRATAEGGKPA
jgi:glycosyltransferase involved in cell wall biosynthesis